MSRTIRYAVLGVAIAATTACSASVTEPTPTAKCAATQNSSSSCVSLDLINPKV